MSLPPVTIKIKRKATDEPVEYLRIHETSGIKRHKKEAGFVFTRQSIGNSNPLASGQPTPPAANSVALLNPPAVASSLDAPISQADVQHQHGGQGTGSAVGSGSTAHLTKSGATSAIDTTNAPPLAKQPRRFHISRIATPSENQSPITGRKRKAEPTVFVERRSRSRPVSQEGFKPETENIKEQPQLPTEEARPRKKPGLAARNATPPVKPPPVQQHTQASLHNIRLPSGAVLPWNVDDERLAAEMQAYTLQEIGKNLTAIEAANPTPNPVTTTYRKPNTSKFKPKKPTLRYAERHPEDIINSTAMDVDENFVEEEDDDSEYIIETYIRIPAGSVENEDSQKTVGLLILDSQPDIDEFYREQEESDEEEEDEDEDENAENHYTADYPDEEVDSDDEYDRNPYSYRTHNASDLEEFDEDDATFSDDENEATKYPWMKRP